MNSSNYCRAIIVCIRITETITEINQRDCLGSLVPFYERWKRRGYETTYVVRLQD